MLVYLENYTYHSLISKNDSLKLYLIKGLSLEKNAFTCEPFKSISHLDLHDSEIKILRNGCFNGLDNLKSLNLKYCDIDDIEDDVFIDLPNLNELDLTFNKLKRIKSSLFNGLTKLKKLCLNQLTINKIDDNCFDQLINLKSLELIETKVKEPFHNDLFKELTNLISLNVHQFEFEIIEETTNPFKILSGLKNFRESQNYLHLLNQTQKLLLTEVHYVNANVPKLINGYFNGFTGLKKLTLNTCLTSKEIEDDVFDDLSNLQVLKLINNRLRGHNFHKLFKKLTKLRKLYLNENLIFTIQKDYFQSLVNLNVLELKSCYLKSIDLNAFSSLMKLNKLNLTGNQDILNMYHKKDFEFLPKLKNFSI